MTTMAGANYISNSDYNYDERSQKSDSNEGKGASLNRKKPYLSG